MPIQLTPELERLVIRKVADGPYESGEDVLRAALLLLVERGEASLDGEGRLRAWAAEGFADLNAERSSEKTARDISGSARERVLG